ncbi:MAG: Rnase Y domain-containing protein, partial [Planctomycetota bacterium]
MLPYVVGLISLVVGAAIGYFVERTMRGGAYKTRDEIVQQAQREAENIGKSAELAAKEDGFRRREAIEKEINQARDELRNQERALDKREAGIKEQ